MVICAGICACIGSCCAGRLGEPWAAPWAESGLGARCWCCWCCWASASVSEPGLLGDGEAAGVSKGLNPLPGWAAAATAAASFLASVETAASARKSRAALPLWTAAAGRGARAGGCAGRSGSGFLVRYSRGCERISRFWADLGGDGSFGGCNLPTGALRGAAGRPGGAGGGPERRRAGRAGPSASQPHHSRTRVRSAFALHQPPRVAKWDGFCPGIAGRGRLAAGSGLCAAYDPSPRAHTPPTDSPEPPAPPPLPPPPPGTRGP